MKSIFIMKFNDKHYRKFNLLIHTLLSVYFVVENIQWVNVRTLRIWNNAYKSTKSQPPQPEKDFDCNLNSNKVHVLHDTLPVDYMYTQYLYLSGISFTSCLPHPSLPLMIFSSIYIYVCVFPGSILNVEMCFF